MAKGKIGQAIKVWRDFQAQFDVLPQTPMMDLLNRLSKKETKALEYVVSRKVPVLFLGKSRAGKTKLAMELRKMGIAAYAPEDISVITLGENDTDVDLNKNDRGYPVLLSKNKLVRLA